MTSIAFTGDISFTKYMTDGWKRDDLLDETVTEFLHSADHVVANVECALSNDATTGTGLKHASDPAAGAFIRDVIGADIWTLANNHMLDCKEKGLLDTLDTAKKYGVQTIGAGVNKEAAAKPVILPEAGGIGMFSTVYDYEPLRTPEDRPGMLLWDAEDIIRQQIRSIKEKCRWCVLVVHGGRCEFSQLPLPMVRKKLKGFLDMGADVVVAHHPHVVQNYETFGKKMIFYSLGNFIFDTDYQRIQKHTEYGMLLKLKFTETQWSWECLPTLVDRKHNRIVAGKRPAVFTEISPLEYWLLTDLNHADYNICNRSSRLEINAEKYGAFTAADWYNNDVDRMGVKGAKMLYQSLRRVKWGLWKLARKELCEYIGKDLKL